MMKLFIDTMILLIGYLFLKEKFQDYLERLEKKTLTVY